MELNPVNMQGEKVCAVSETVLNLGSCILPISILMFCCSLPFTSNQQSTMWDSKGNSHCPFHCNRLEFQQQVPPLHSLQMFNGRWMRISGLVPDYPTVSTEQNATEHTPDQRLMDETLSFAK